MRGKGVRWEKRALKRRVLRKVCAEKACVEKGVRLNIASLVFCPQIFFIYEITRHLGRKERGFEVSKSIKCDPKFWHCGNFISEKRKNLSQCKIDLECQKLILQFFIARIDGSSLGADPHMTVLIKPQEKKEIFFCLLKKVFLIFLFSSSKKLQKRKNMIFSYTVPFSCFSVIFEWILSAWQFRQIFAFLK